MRLEAAAGAEGMVEASWSRLRQTRKGGAAAKLSGASSIEGSGKGRDWGGEEVRMPLEKDEW